jgi:hypothetical protein
MAAPTESISAPRVLKLTGRTPIRASDEGRVLHKEPAAPEVAPGKRAVARDVFFLTVPRQHGAWASLLSAYVLGIAATGQLGLAPLLLLVALLAAFFGRQAGLLAVKLPASDPRRTGFFSWTAFYVAAFFAAGVPLLTVWGLTRLVPLGAAAFAFLALTMVLERRRQAFTAFAETTGFIGLSLAAPAAEYAASGTFTTRTVAVGLMAAAYFVGSMLHVRYLLRSRPETLGSLGGRLRAGAAPVIFHLHLFGLATAATGAGLLPILAPFVFAPAVAKVLWAVLHRRGSPIPVRTLGWMEVVHTLLFISLVALVYRWPA